MTTLLLSVLAATSLAAAGIGTPSETRSAQSLPNGQFAVASPNSAVTGKLNPTNRLVQPAPDNSEPGETAEAKCNRTGGRWDEKKLRCRRGLAWEVPVIGAATVAGLIYAISSSDNSGTGSISH